MRRVYSLLVGLVVACLLVLGIGTQAWAIGNPVYVSIEDVAAFRNVLTIGDQLYFCRYDVSYAAVNMTEPAKDTWQMAIYGTDETTLIASRALNYYQHNIISIYFTPSEALTWGAAYKIKIMGNPGIFSPLIEGVNMRTRALGSADFREKADLGAYLIGQAEILDADWPSITLLTAQNKLNTTGASYFTKAIPGLYNMVPEIFQYVATYPSYNATSWTTAGQDIYTAQKGPSLTAAVADIADFVGTTPDWIGINIVGFLALMLGAAIYAPTRRPDVAVLFAAAVLPLGVWMGLIELSWWIVIFLLVGIAFAVLFIQSRFS